MLKPGVLQDAKLEARPALAFVFDAANSPLALDLPARLAPDWGMEMNSAADPPPHPRLDGPVVQARLIPYGAAKLRVSVFPRGGS